MPDANKYFAIRRHVTGSTFEPVLVPIDCGQVVIQNADATNAQAIRSDKDDPDTEKNLPASAELTIRAQTQCFTKGDTLCYVKAAAGSGPIVLTFVR